MRSATSARTALEDLLSMEPKPKPKMCTSPAIPIASAEPVGAVDLPILEENERLFGTRIEDRLTVNGLRKALATVYRKTAAVKPKELE